MHKLYLSRRNLQTLINKLDRLKAGEETKCTIIKFNERPSFPNSMDEITVVAIDDDKYYCDFSPGIVYPADEPKNK